MGSPEHKDYQSVAGPPALRRDGTSCPKSLLGSDLTKDVSVLTEALRDGIRRGQVGEEIAGFPKYVWVILDGVVYEARHINGPQGDYKGYELDPAEYPDNLSFLS